MKRFLRIEAGAPRRYEVETSADATVLDALEILRGKVAPGLRYRHSCHHGSCGTCGALVNGKPALMCLVKLHDLPEGDVVLASLPGAESLGDLALRPSRLFESLPDTGYLRGPEGARSLEACIECGLCIAACPVPSPFAGPAALAAADRERESRPERGPEMIAFAGRREGAASCARAFGCSRACPQGVAPGKRITALLRDLRVRDRE